MLSYAVFRCVTRGLREIYSWFEGNLFVVWGKFIRGLGEIYSWFEGNLFVVWGKLLVV